MQSHGDAALTSVRTSATLLQEACGLEVSSLPDAIAHLEAAIAAAEAAREPAVLATSLRRLAVARHHRNETAEARQLCHRSYDIAWQASASGLAAEALNTLGAIDLTTGALEEARGTLLKARDLASEHRGLRARVEQNLGILANIRGEQLEALGHYERSLEDYRAEGDDQGCAAAYHNLGMVNADRGRLEAAACYYQESYAIAERTGNLYLQGLCLVNHGAVEVAQQRFEVGRKKAEAALELFDRLGALAPKSSAYRIIGMAYRDTGRATAAETALKTAIDVAVATRSVLNEAEATRELALLYQSLTRYPDALRLLTTAHGLFKRLNARVRLADTAKRLAELKQSLELPRG